MNRYHRELLKSLLSLLLLTVEFSSWQPRIEFIKIHGMQLLIQEHKKKENKTFPDHFSFGPGVNLVKCLQV